MRPKSMSLTLFIQKIIKVYLLTIKPLLSIELKFLWDKLHKVGLSFSPLCKPLTALNIKSSSALLVSDHLSFKYRNRQHTHFFLYKRGWKVFVEAIPPLNW